jgi:hypothetical protein
MFKNRFLIFLGVLSLLLVAMVISFPLSNAPTSAERGRAADTSRWQAMSVYYAKQAEAQRLKGNQPYVIDSATRSYIAWGEALQGAGKLGDPAAGSNTTQENIFAGIDSNLDSATRSYIAWGEALQAAGKLGESGVCSNTTRENLFAGIDSSLDSATRSYIAWGLALQARNDIHACH